MLTPIVATGVNLKAGKGGGWMLVVIWVPAHAHAAVALFVAVGMVTCVMVVVAVCSRVLCGLAGWGDGLG